MNLSKRLLVSCIALGLGVTGAYAEDAHHPETPATAAAVVETGVDATGKPETVAATTGMPMMGMMGQDGMRGGQGGMPMMGMMSQDGMRGGQGGMPMMGMMGKGMHGGPDMMARHSQVTSRLDLMDARLAKIETLLEHLNRR